MKSGKKANKQRMNGISGREIEVISYLELEGKRFFERKDIRKFFMSDNEMNVYMHRLMMKGRVVKISKNKYYLVPIQAYHSKWSEHPFIVIDELFDGKGYCIGGRGAAHYWGITEQIPADIEVFSRTRQGKKVFFGFVIRFRRVRRMPRHVRKKINGHNFLIASKEESRRWK